MDQASSSSSSALTETEPLLGANIQANMSHQIEDGAVSLHADARAAQKVLKKIDRVIIPLLFFTYLLNFMDKIILSSAAVFGLRDDNHLHGQQYNWVSSIFYFGSLLWSYPASLLIAKLPTGKYMSANTLLWGTVVALTATCSSFGGLMTVRFLLGVAESVITPGFMFLTSTWYTREEMPTRVGLWFTGNSLGGLVASLMAFGLGHVKDNVHPWRWMYIILGVVTFLWAIPLFFLLPDNISKAKFLTPDERKVAANRVAKAGTGSTENKSWKLAQVKECLIDPKTWFIVAIELLCQIPNGGTQTFSNIVLESFGFTSLQSTLINMPYSILSAAVVAGSGYLAGRFRTLNCALIIVVVIPCIIGSAIIYRRDAFSHAAQLVAYFLLCTGPAAMPLNIALVQSNFCGVTKKLTITALLFLAYCVGNITGPLLFHASEAPTYSSGFHAIMICYALVVGLTIGLRTYLVWINAKRTIVEEVEGDNGLARGVLADRVASKAYDEVDDNAVTTRASLAENLDDDVTDWNIPGFRYRL